MSTVTIAATGERTRPLRVALIALAGVSLLTGLNAGLLRLGVWAPVASDRVADLHGPVMVLGFMGTLISLERAQAMRNPLAYLVPALLGGGSLALLAGAPTALGKLILLDGALGFVVLALALWRRAPLAFLTALAVSGLPSDRFTFEGFVSRKPGERRRALADVAEERRTMVFFEAPHRLGAFLGDAADALGADRPAVVCRELTKTYEEVLRGTLSELATWAQGEVRGEITIVVAGAVPRAGSLPEAVDDVVAQVEAGERFKAAVSAAAERHGVAKQALYDAALVARKERA